MDDSNVKNGHRILVADDDHAFREAFCQMLTMRGFRTTQATTKSEVLDRVRESEFDLLTLDLDWGAEDGAGIGIYREVLKIDSLLPVIVITGHASIPTAVEATRLGAFDYIEKIQDRERTLLTIKNAVEAGKLKRENRAFLTEIRRRYEIIGDSPAIGAVCEQIRKVGPTDSVVLINGESGTGKELVARQIHYYSKRRERSFVSVDSGMLADSLAESELFGHRKGAFTGAMQDRRGLFEDADGGTIFLDEITNASLTLQAKLLHVLQEREFRRVGDNELRKCDIRVIAATNQNLPQMIKDGKFRNDLYYRLKVMEIALPPLRERKEDIPLLVYHFVRTKSRQHSGHERSLSAEAVNLLFDYDWPGNVRELENTIERVVILSSKEEISGDEVKTILGDLWLEKETSLKPLSEMTREFKRECILKAINLAEGRIAKAAEILQIDRTHLYKLIDEYQLKNIQ